MTQKVMTPVLTIKVQETEAVQTTSNSTVAHVCEFAKLKEFVEDLSFRKDACQEYLKQLVQCSLASYPKGERLGVVRKHVNTLTGSDDDDIDDFMSKMT